MKQFKLRSILDFDQPNEPIMDQSPTEPNQSPVDDQFQSFFSTLDFGGGGNDTKTSPNDEVSNPGSEATNVPLPDTGNAPPADPTPQTAQPEPLTPPAQDSSSDRIAALENQIASLMGVIQGQQQATQPAEPAPMADPFDGEAFQNLSTVFDWDTNEQAAMKTFLKAAFDFNSENVINQATAGIPDIVNSSMNAAQKQQAIKDKFYTDHPMLANTKPFVAEISRNIAKEYQALGRSIDPMSLLNETAKRAYTALGISPNQSGHNNNQPIPNAPAAQSGSGDPAFASGTGGGGRVPPVTKSEDQQMIDAIIDLDI